MDLRPLQGFTACQGVGQVQPRCWDSERLREAATVMLNPSAFLPCDLCLS